MDGETGRPRKKLVRKEKYQLAKQLQAIQEASIKQVEESDTTTKERGGVSPTDSPSVQVSPSSQSSDTSSGGDSPSIGEPMDSAKITRILKYEDDHSLFRVLFGEGKDDISLAEAMFGIEVDEEQFDEEVLLSRDQSEKLSWNKCLKGPEAEEWKEAMETEKATLHKHGAIKQVCRVKDIPRSTSKCKIEVVHAFPILTLKWDSLLGRLVKKVRLVADGAHQKHLEGVNTFSPTPGAPYIRLVTALAAKHKLPIHHADVERAFLHTRRTNSDVRVFLLLPEGVEEEGMCWELDCVLYGLREAPREYYKFQLKNCASLV